MARRFLPSKGWEWAVASLLGTLLGAFFLSPVYAYSGPGISHGRVARELGEHRRITGHWSSDPRWYEVERIPPRRSYDYRLENASKRSAAYEITVDGKAETWIVRDEGRPKRL